MSIDLLLTEDEIKELTGFAHSSKQIQALRDMGFSPLIRPRDGRPLLVRSALEGVKHEPEINYSVL